MTTYRVATAFRPGTFRGTDHVTVRALAGPVGVSDNEVWMIIGRAVTDAKGGRGDWMFLASQGEWIDRRVPWTMTPPNVNTHRAVVDWEASHNMPVEAVAVRVRRPRHEDVPVGLAEIAARLGVTRDTVDTWRTRGVLPEPSWTVGGRPAWAWSAIEAWARETGRHLTPLSNRKEI